MPFIEILLPTGHREKIEVNTNTILITVLEDVCLKRGLNVDHCYLSYNKAKIDLSLKFGISRLLNNAKLDLIVSPTSLIENVVIDVVLQLPNASRVNNSFSPKENIFSIMQRFANSESELMSVIFPIDNYLTPVIYYLHDQIVGEFCLKNTTLASLGLRSGRILFRLEFKNISDEDKQILEEITRLRIAKSLSRAGSRQNTVVTSEIVEPMLNKTSISEPTNEHRFTNQSFETTAAMGGAMDLDVGPFSAFSSNQISMFDNRPSKKQVPAHQKEPQTLGEILGINLEHESQVGEYGAPDTQSFLDFKFPELPDDGRTTTEEIEDTSKVICKEDRENVLYLHKPDEYTPNNGEDVPETFFDLTEQDLRSIIQSYRNIAESDNPLMTSALKAQMREKRFAKYQRCIIQFHFKDAYILQSVFKPQETVDDMYNCVKDYFHSKNASFYLYTSPPKEILKHKEKNLIQSDLVPMCKVYVSIGAKDLFTNVDQLLSGDECKAREIIEKWMKTERGEPIGSGSAGQDRGTSGNAHKMPKWFKSGN